MLYECLTGQPPFPRATDVALLWAHVHEEPTPPSQARPELPEGTRHRRRPRPREGARAALRLGGELVAATRSRSRLAEEPPATGAHSSRGRCRRGGRRRSWRSLWSRHSSLYGATQARPSTVAPDSVGVIDRHERLVAEVPVGRRPGGDRRRRRARSGWRTSTTRASRASIRRTRTRGPWDDPVGDYPSDLTAGRRGLGRARCSRRARRASTRSRTTPRARSRPWRERRAAARGQRCVRRRLRLVRVRGRRARARSTSSTGHATSIGSRPAFSRRRAPSCPVLATSRSGSDRCGSSNRAANAVVEVDGRARSSVTITVGRVAGGDRGRRGTLVGRELRGRHGLADRTSPGQVRRRRSRASRSVTARRTSPSARAPSGSRTSSAAP